MNGSLFLDDFSWYFLSFSGTFGDLQRDCVSLGGVRLPQSFWKLPGLPRLPPPNSLEVPWNFFHCGFYNHDGSDPLFAAL